MNISRAYLSDKRKKHKVKKEERDLGKLLMEAELAREELLQKRKGSFNNTFTNLDDYNTNMADLEYLIQELKKKLDEMT